MRNTAAHAIIPATEDDAWRVREMAAKVIARHRVGYALAAVAGLRDNPVPRVRAAARRAVVILTAEKCEDGWHHAYVRNLLATLRRRAVGQPMCRTIQDLLDGLTASSQSLPGNDGQRPATG